MQTQARNQAISKKNGILETGIESMTLLIDVGRNQY